MSKCGYCGNMDMGTHMVLECKANITEDMYNKIECWLESVDGTTFSLLEKDEAVEILSEIKERYNNTTNGGNE